jgi:predicted thioesterase
VECLALDYGGAGVVEHVEAARHLAAVARGSRAVAVAIRESGRLLLDVVLVGAKGRVVGVVALIRRVFF